MYLSESIEKYLNDSASCIPAPGGGSVSALIGALASAMASMSIHFTIGKQGFKQNTGRLTELLIECEKSREVLTLLMQEDVDIYNEVDKTFRMPKITNDEKRLRFESMRRATIFAMTVPLKTAMSCLYVLKLTRELVEITNPNLISEVGVAAILADAGFQCAKINVDINLSHMNNLGMIQKVQNEMYHAEKTAKIYFNEIYKIVQKKMCGENQVL